jgi:hypothetical protein
MPKNNLIALWLIASGMAISCWMSFALPAEKLSLFLPLPGSLVGAGLARWEK